MARDMGSSKVTIAYHTCARMWCDTKTYHATSQPASWPTREYFAYLQCKSCWWPISWISLTIGTSSVAASGMRNNGVTNFVFKGLRFAQPRINTRHSSRPTGSFQSSFRKLLLITFALRAHSNRRNSTQISLRSICYWKWFFHYSDDWSERSERNEECFLNELDYLIILYYPACARRCVYTREESFWKRKP